MKSFRLNLARPFTILAPMDGVTDVVFRQIIAETGRPDVFFTEFVNVEGLTSKGSERVAEALKFGKNELPVVAHIWGKDPHAFYKASKMCKQMGLSGIDINMGCPDRVIVNRGNCAALIKNPELAKEIIEATRKGAGGLPISVKTRLGFDQIDLEWIKFLLNQNLSAITIHLRTVLEMSKVPAHWELMSQVVKLRDEISPETLIIGNGDILSFKEIEEKYKKYVCDGFMVGRGIFQNPWFFNRSVDEEKVTIGVRLNLFIKHINLFDKTWKDGKNPANLGKFCKTYVSNFPDALSLREKIMECRETAEMLVVLNEYKLVNSLSKLA
jgi:tRNA-dihydrouridine synthase